jgi:hypothetical protein
MFGPGTVLSRPTGESGIGKDPVGAERSCRGGECEPLQLGKPLVGAFRVI